MEGHPWENPGKIRGIPCNWSNWLVKSWEHQWTVLIPHGDLPWGCYDDSWCTWHELFLKWDLMGGSPYPFLWFSNGFQISNVMIPNVSKWYHNFQIFGIQMDLKWIKAIYDSHRVRWNPMAPWLWQVKNALGFAMKARNPTQLREAGKGGTTLWWTNSLLWKITIFMGKFTISMAIFNSFLCVHQRVSRK